MSGKVRGIGIIVFFIGCFGMGGAIETDSSIMAAAIFFLLGITIYMMGGVAEKYEAWKEAERNRISNAVEYRRKHYGFG